MSKIKMFFGKKAGIYSILIFALIISLGCLSVSASTTSKSFSFSLSKGSTKTSLASATYASGTHKAAVHISSFTATSTLDNTTMLNLTLNQDNGTTSLLLSSVTKTIKALTTEYTYNFGSQSSSTKYISATNKISGTSYGAVSGTGTVTVS